MESTATKRLKAILAYVSVEIEPDGGTHVTGKR
jgi:hypothetical protein